MAEESKEIKFNGSNYYISHSDVWPDVGPKDFYIQFYQKTIMAELEKANKNVIDNCSQLYLTTASSADPSVFWFQPVYPLEWVSVDFSLDIDDKPKRKKPEQLSFSFMEEK